MLCARATKYTRPMLIIADFIGSDRFAVCGFSTFRGSSFPRPYYPAAAVISDATGATRDSHHLREAAKIDKAAEAPRGRAERKERAGWG